VLRGRRAAGALVASAALAGIVDEAQNGPRILRRIVRRRRRTVNLIARMGERGAPGTAGSAPNTLVVIAHHDAPQSGAIFDQTLQRRLYERAPQVLERFKTPPPQWWIGLSGPLATVATALTGRRGFARAGLAIGLLGTAAVADIWRNDTVQAPTTTFRAWPRWWLSRSFCSAIPSPACACCSYPAARRRRCRTASARSSRVIAQSSIRRARHS